MPVEPSDIIAAGRSWLGMPWRHQGRTRQGVDCAGLVVLVGRGLGLADYDTQAYGRRPEGQGFVQHFRAAMDGLPLPEARPGDVLSSPMPPIPATAASSPRSTGYRICSTPMR
jgi:cell wall-associated NlpC family hydrolase